MTTVPSNIPAKLTGSTPGLSSPASSTMRLVGVLPSEPGYCAPGRCLTALRERRRIRRLLRALHNGEWRKVLLDLQVSQYAWPKLQAHGGRVAELLTKVNFIALACRMHADVLVGTPPVIGVPDGFEQHRAALAALDRDNAIEGLLHSTARKINVEAEAALRVDISGGRAVLTLDDNDQTLPVGPDGPDLQPTVWERRWVIERPNPLNPARPRRFLRVERHRAVDGRGLVEQEAYKTDTDETLLDLAALTRVPLAQLGIDLPDSTETGASRPLITRFVSDYYDGCPQFPIQESDLDLVDTVAMAMSGLARSHTLHSRPKVRIDEGMIDKKTGNVDLTADAFVDPDKRLEYIVAPLQLEQMLSFMERSVSMFLTMVEISPALIGMKMNGGANPDSIDKLRLESTVTIARANRCATYFGSALERALTTAAEVESTLPLRGYAVGPVSVKMRPQLPKDRLEQVREIAEERKAGLLDEDGAVLRLHGPDEGPAVLARIKARREEAARAKRIGDVEYERARQGFPLVTRLSGEQMKVLLELAQLVNAGEVSEDMALGMLVGLGFEEDIARRMVAQQAGLPKSQEDKLLEGVL